MRFISKAKDPSGKSRESVFDPDTNAFYDFVGGVLDTEDPRVMGRLTELGYGSVEGVKVETFKCDQCGFVSKNGTGLAAHIRSHKEKQ